MALSLKKKPNDTDRISTVMVIALLALLVVGPILAARKSLALSPKLQTFAAEWDARDASIRQAASQKSNSITVPPFSVDLADYVNVASVEGDFVTCLKDYYHIQTLVVQ